LYSLHILNVKQYCPITIVVPLNNIKDAIKNQDPANLVNQWCKGKELGEYSKVQFSILYQPHNALSPANQQSEEVNLILILVIFTFRPKMPLRHWWFGPRAKITD
jgi:hypothetical protein